MKNIQAAMTNVKWTWRDFAEGAVVVDFRDYTIPELHHLRLLLDKVNIGRSTPAYTVDACYYCKYDRWFAGGTHNMIGHQVCRATEIKI